MDEDKNSPELPNISAKDLEDFKKDLLATVYNQTNTQLLIYQRGKCLKTSLHLKNRKPSKPPTVLLNDEPMPSEEILDDIKLDKELDALRNIYEIAYHELSKKIPTPEETNEECEENPHANLIKAIESRKQNNNEVDMVAKELRDNKSTLRQLKDQLKAEEVETEQRITAKGERLDKLREQLRNIKRLNDLECRLVERWEANRLSQAQIMGENEERAIMKEIVHLHRPLAGEKRLICEVEAFRKNEAAELQEKINHWEKKFQDEKAKILSKNLKLSQSIADILKTHEKLSEIKEQRKEFVKEYLIQKEEERRLYEEQMYRVECAVRIQAWWRGTMVRNGLGPFRKKSKKGKKGKGKK
ncbi:dynein regulatory complex protein 9 [Haematobia irritans]|uniref:dynein regulatory complex protein 9 n=1 Tax=Haematobia irritans TaxID=7368 RepID=UPI003F4F88E1